MTWERSLLFVAAEGIVLKFGDPECHPQLPHWGSLPPAAGAQLTKLWYPGVRNLNSSENFWGLSLGLGNSSNDCASFGL